MRWPRLAEASFSSESLKLSHRIYVDRAPCRHEQAMRGYVRQFRGRTVQIRSIRRRGHTGISAATDSGTTAAINLRLILLISALAVPVLTLLLVHVVLPTLLLPRPVEGMAPAPAARPAQPPALQPAPTDKRALAPSGQAEGRGSLPPATDTGAAPPELPVSREQARARCLALAAEKGIAWDTISAVADAPGVLFSLDAKDSGLSLAVCLDKSPYLVLSDQD